LRLRKDPKIGGSLPGVLRGGGGEGEVELGVEAVGSAAAAVVDVAVRRGLPSVRP
jgi:hypothetical protein